MTSPRPGSATRLRSPNSQGSFTTRHQKTNTVSFWQNYLPEDMYSALSNADNQGQYTEDEYIRLLLDVKGRLGLPKPQQRGAKRSPGLDDKIHKIQETLDTLQNKLKKPIISQETAKDLASKTPVKSKPDMSPTKREPVRSPPALKGRPQPEPNTDNLVSARGPQTSREKHKPQTSPRQKEPIRSSDSPIKSSMKKESKTPENPRGRTPGEKGSDKKEPKTKGAGEVERLKSPRTPIKTEKSEDTKKSEKKEKGSSRPDKGSLIRPEPVLGSDEEEAGNVTSRQKQGDEGSKMTSQKDQKSSANPLKDRVSKSSKAKGESPKAKKTLEDEKAKAKTQVDNKEKSKNALKKSESANKRPDAEAKNKKNEPASNSNKKEVKKNPLLDEKNKKKKTGKTPEKKAVRESLSPRGSDRESEGPDTRRSSSRNKKQKNEKAHNIPQKLGNRSRQVTETSGVDSLSELDSDKLEIIEDDDEQLQSQSKITEQHETNKSQQKQPEEDKKITESSQPVTQQPSEHANTTNQNDSKNKNIPKAPNEKNMKNIEKSKGNKVQEDKGKDEKAKNEKDKGKDLKEKRRQERENNKTKNPLGNKFQSSRIKQGALSRGSFLSNTGKPTEKAKEETPESGTSSQNSDDDSRVGEEEEVIQYQPNETGHGDSNSTHRREEEYEEMHFEPNANDNQTNDLPNEDEEHNSRKARKEREKQSAHVDRESNAESEHGSTGEKNREPKENKWETRKNAEPVPLDYSEILKKDQEPSNKDVSFHGSHNESRSSIQMLNDQLNQDRQITNGSQKDQANFDQNSVHSKTSSQTSSRKESGSEGLNKSQNKSRTAFQIIQDQLNQSRNRGDNVDQLNQSTRSDQKNGTNDVAVSTSIPPKSSRQSMMEKFGQFMASAGSNQESQKPQKRK